jgi:hypothetical protein
MIHKLSSLSCLNATMHAYFENTNSQNADPDYFIPFALRIPYPAACKYSRSKKPKPDARHGIMAGTAVMNIARILRRINGCHTCIGHWISLQVP